MLDQSFIEQLQIIAEMKFAANIFMLIILILSLVPATIAVRMLIKSYSNYKRSSDKKDK